jgi:hypothetical protein
MWTHDYLAPWDILPHSKCFHQGTWQVPIFLSYSFGESLHRWWDWTTAGFEWGAILSCDLLSQCTWPKYFPLSHGPWTPLSDEWQEWIFCRMSLHTAPKGHSRLLVTHQWPVTLTLPNRTLCSKHIFLQTCKTVPRETDSQGKKITCPE